MSGTPTAIRVLHVDDDRDLGGLVAAALEREDDRFDVLTATNPDDALDTLADERVDCVVSDYDMPGATGIEFLETVRERDPDLPFVLYTGKGSEEVASEAISAGVTDYLQKGTGTDQYALLANRIDNAVSAARSRSALEERNRRLETLISNLPGVVYRCRNEPPWPMEFVAGECEELTGYTAAELERGAVVWGEEVLHPEDRDRMWETVQSALDAGDPFEVSYRIRTADGEVRWMWERGRAIGDGADRIEGFITDVTERERREEALSALTDATRRFMDAPDRETVADHAVETAAAVLDKEAGGLWFVDDDGSALRPVAATDAAVDLIGELPTYTGGESLTWEGFRSGELIVCDDLQTESGRYSPQTPLGSEIILPLGEYGVMAVGATELAAFDEVDVSLARILANTVEAALDRAAREQESREHRRELERQNERLDEFAGIVSHDLRNPLQVATARAEFLAEEVDSEHLTAVQRAHDRMEALIDDLLTLGREGKAVLDIEPVALDALARTCWETVGTADGSLVVETDGSVRADRRRLQQLLENLMGNAVEHGSTDPGSPVRENGGELNPDGPANGSPGSRPIPVDGLARGDAASSGVSVRVGTLDDGSGFFVADDGPGVSEERREEVFASGYSTDPEGTGFGLSIVEQIAQAHGWSVAVTESESGGARFEITDVDVAD